MNCWIRFWEIVAIIAYLASSSAFAQQANVEAGKKEGKVGVYGSVVPQAMEGLHQAFKKIYGIDVEYCRGSSTLVSEWSLAEWLAGWPGFDGADGNRAGCPIRTAEGRLAVC